MAPRVAVIVPCFNGGRLLADAVASIDEAEPIEVVVVDDGSDDPVTLATLARLREDGVRVVRHERNRGLSVARHTGLAATRARHVLPLDADDLAEPGALAAMADRLDGAPRRVVACVGDYLEFRGPSEVVRAVPQRLDPYRVALTNEYPITSLFRWEALAAVGGWRDPLPAHPGYEDWNLWMALAERGAGVVHLGPGRIVYRRRLHAPGLNASARARHPELYRALRDAHPRLFADLPAHRRRSDLSGPRRALYPLVYGARPKLAAERVVKPLLDRAGVWTQRRR